MLAERMSRVSASPTLKVLVEADKLRQQGVDVVEFGAGEPDFPTPDHVKAAAHAAIDANFTKYTPAAGTGELKQADRHALQEHVRRRLQGQRGHRQRRRQAGALQRGNGALRRGRRGDHARAVLADAHRAGAPGRRDARCIAQTSAEDGFTLDAQTLLNAVTPQTRAIIINSPCNPTGALMDEHQMAMLADEVAGTNIWVIVDLCYEQLIYEPIPHNLPKVLARQDARPDDPLRVGVEVVLDDRLALRLGRRPGGGDRGLQRASEPLDVERLVDLAEGGARRGRLDRRVSSRRCSRSTASAATRCTPG